MDIEKIKEKEYNIETALKQHFEDEIRPDIGICSYLIFPDGTLIGGYAHRDFLDYLADEGILTEEELDKWDTDIFNEVFNCVRCTDIDADENYIGLPSNRLTDKQFEVLKEWLENNFEIGRDNILVTANFGKENSSAITYEYKKIIEDGDWPSDYIINRIKRYYSSGKLVEDIEAEVAEDAIVDKVKSLLPKYGHPIYFDNNNNLMLDNALDTLFNFMSDQWSVWVDDYLVDAGNLETMLDKFSEMLENNTNKRVELCAGNVDGFLHTYLVSDPNNYLFVREDIEADTDPEIDDYVINTKSEPNIARLNRGIAGRSFLSRSEISKTLTKIEIPHRINGTIISRLDNFCDLENLETVVLPNSITTICTSAFRNCPKLKNINFPSSLVEIWADAFAHTGLTDIVLPANIEYLGTDAFSFCNELETVTFTGNFNYLNGIPLFKNCPKLKKFTFKKDFWFTDCRYVDVERFFRGITHDVDIIFEEHLSHKRMINFLKKFAQNNPNFHISGPDFDDATLEEDIEEVEYDGVLTPSEEENHTWKLGLEQLIVLKDWQDKYYSFAKGPGVYRLNYDGIIRKLEGARLDDFVIRDISLVREYYHYSKEYSTIRYILNIDDVVSDNTHYFTLVSLDVDNLAAILCKWDEPEHTPHIQASFDKLVSVYKLEEMLGLGDFTKNKMEEMVKCFKNGAEEITEDVEETVYEDEPIYCVTISVGTDETVMCYLLNEELKLRLINNGLLDGYYLNDVGIGNLLAVDWLYFVSSTPENSVMHNQIMIPALRNGTVGQRNLLLYMKPEQIRYVSEFPRKLITHWPMNEDIEEDEWEISHLIHNNRNSYSETKTWTLDDKALKLLEELQAEFPTSLLSRFNFKRLMERYDSFSLTRVTIEDGDLFHYYDIHYKLNYYDSTHVWGDGSDHLAFMRLTDFKQVATNNVINKDKHFEVTGTLITALERADVLEELEKTLGIEEFTKTKLEEATAEIEKLVANNNAKYQKIKEDIEEEPYDDKYMSLINLQIINDYAADHLDGGGWIWKDFGIIVEDNPMAGPYIVGIFKATDDPNKFIRYDLDSIPEDILSDEELSYMNPEETDIDEYVPNLMYALESKDNHTITDIINKIEANANQETVTLKAALNFIEEYWGTDEELDSWIKDEQEYHLNNANYLNIVEKLNEDIEEEPYVDSSGACADITLLKTAYSTHNDERYWIWEMPAEVLIDISKKYDTYNARSFDKRFFDFESLINDPDFSWRIKRVITDDGSHYTSSGRHIHIASIKYMYYCYCKPDREVVNYRYELTHLLGIYTGKQFDEEDSATLNKIRELDTLLGVPEKYRIDNIIEQINDDYLDLYEDVKEEPININTSDDDIILVTKFKSFWGKYKYRSIYYDINLDKTELVDYLLDLYMGLQLEQGYSEDDIEHDIKLIRNREKDCVLYIDYKPEDKYSLGIYEPDSNNTLGLAEMPKDIAKKIIGDKLVTDLIQEDIEEVPPTEKDFLPEYSSKYLNWDKDTEERKKSIELINNHWNEKIWFLTAVGGREYDVYSPRKYMTFAEAYNDFITYDKFVEDDYLNDCISLNAKGFALSPNETQKNYSCILFRGCEEPEYTPDMSVTGINEDIKEIPQQSNINVDPINNSYIYSIFNNYASCDCNGAAKTIVTRDRDKKRWFIKYAADIMDDEEIITKELLTFDEAFKMFLDLPLNYRTNSYALICTNLTEGEKSIIKRGNTIEPFYITNDRFERFVEYLDGLE